MSKLRIVVLSSLIIFVASCGGGLIANKIESSTQVNSPVEIQLSSTGHKDARNVRFEVTSQPSYGSIEGEPPNVLYRPARDFVGVDSFSYIAIEIFPEDPNKDPLVSEDATVTINVVDESTDLSVSGIKIAPDFIAISHKGILVSECQAEIFYIERSSGKAVMLSNAVESYLSKLPISVVVDRCEDLDGDNVAPVVTSVSLLQ